MTHWEFYRTPDRRVVAEELIALLPDVAAKARLGELLDRIAGQRTLSGDVRKLEGEIFEARLSYAGNEYRLHFAYLGGGTRVILGLHAVQKRSRKARPRDIRTSEDRLAAWRTSHGL